MEPLKDPKNDRQIKQVKPPPHRPLDKNLMFPNKLKNKPDWKLLKDHLSKEGRITKEDLLKLISDANKIFKSEGNLIQLQDPLVVVGDIHGQYYDLLKILEIGGPAESTKYLFLGDFVDRGSFSIEVLILLYALKINFPSTIYFLRGNHECRQMTSFFNFRDECLYKFDQEIYDVFMDSFDTMPLACIVNGKFLALHGGISPELKTLDDLKKIDRFKEPPRQGLFCDVLWADPVDNDEGVCENIYRFNDVRGCSYFYGIDAVNKFLENNGLLSVIRAHEAQLEGFKMHRWNGSGDFPVVITIFSAANYCDVYNNKGAVIKFDNNTLNIQQFNYTPHPYLLPNFMDVFTWSIPFVSEKVTEMLYNIIRREGEENFESDDDDDDVNLKEKMVNKAGAVAASTGAAITQKKGDVLRNRIKFVSTMIKFNKTLRENNEDLVKLKSVSSDNKIPRGVLDNGKDAIKDAIEIFSTVKKADMSNEKRPDLQKNTAQVKPGLKK